MSGCAAVGCTNRGEKGFCMKSFPRDPERRALWAFQMKRENWQPSNNSRLCEVHFDKDQWEKTREDGSRKLKCSAIPTLFESSQQKPIKKRLKSNIIVPMTPHTAQKSNVSFAFNTKDPVTSEKYSKTHANWKEEIMRKGNTSQRLFSNGISELSHSSPGVRILTCSAINCRSRFNACWSESFFYTFPLDNPVLLKEWLRVCQRGWNPSADSVICRKHFTLDCFDANSGLLLKNNAVPTLFDARNCTESNSTDLLEEIKTSADFDLTWSLELPNNLDEMVIEEEKVVTTYCRLCASSNGETYFPIFGESNLAEKISRCLPIIVLLTDNLPLFVCQRCLHCLNISYKLIVDSISADSFLRSKFTERDKFRDSEESLDTEEKGSVVENDSSSREEPVFRINGPIRCDLCDDFFEDMNAFDTHIETMHLLRWRCSLCDYSFETLEELVAHKTLNHSEQILTCKSCVNVNENRLPIENINSKLTAVIGNNDVSTTREQLLNNPSKLRTSRDEANIDTSSTSGQFLSKASTPKEKLTNLSCTKCKIVFADGKQFRKHHTIHFPRRLRCNLCQKRCSSVFDYLTHKKMVHNQVKRGNIKRREIVHRCKYCKKVFLTKQQLIIHLRNHKDEMFADPWVTVYKCVTCPKKFVDRALYQKHRNVHDPACWHKYRCYTCNRSFMDQFKLRTHQSIHAGEKPYQCDFCGRMFNRNANMIRHRVKHLEQICRHCEQVFANSQNLREHLKDIHGDTLMPKSNSKSAEEGKEVTSRAKCSDDNFVCGYCGKQLTSYYSLLDHERIHTGDKPYVCQHCGKTFRSITARWDHMVRHEKGNYVCELCGKIMSNKLNLKCHLRKHAAIEQRRFECKECGKLFHVKWRLNRHLMRVHHTGPSN